ncbi:MAG: phosphoribosyltransferase [Acidimicrobiales bacterium]
MAPVVLGLARGGVPVGAEVAKALGWPLEVLVSTKIGAPAHEELGIGAVAEGLDSPVLTRLVERLHVGRGDLVVLYENAAAELARRVRLYRAGRGLPELAGRHVVVVDDGMATGVTAEAALLAVRRHDPAWLAVAAPVCARETAERLACLADEVVCARAPRDLGSVGAWYEDFSAVSDDDVLHAVGRAGARLFGSPGQQPARMGGRGLGGAEPVSPGARAGEDGDVPRRRLPGCAKEEAT